MLDPPPPRSVLESARRLDFRALVVLGMLTRKQDILGSEYIYHLNRPYNRVFEMNSFSPLTSPAGENVLGVEIPCHLGSSAWRAEKEELFDMCIGSLSEDGFLAPGDVTELLIARAPYAYPIYRRDYAVHLDRVMGYIDGLGPVSTLGRSGEFVYMDIDDCMKRAFAFAAARREYFAG
jgi:protoporphyrinogen oxidase